MKLSVSSVHPSREFSDLQVALGTPKLAIGVKCKDSPGDCALAIYRLANSVYIEFFWKHITQSYKDPYRSFWLASALPQA